MLLPRSSSPLHANQVNKDAEWEKESFVGEAVYLNKESATVALCKFRLQKNVKTEKRPLTVEGLTKLVQRFEKTGSLKDRVRSGRPSLRQARSARVAAEMETLALESAAKTSSAREGAEA
ncbi:hypothetical protein NPIL_676891 [Nephila pilipes]|uniref:DUF4817 domain-containing protein n=1 Tax=Nephila pilipes TaxID=299642 RepID=A0A8X6N6S3_NEPPI|nr:hypothetical protein NPIL_676891 [Nephila pilipes]